ncbi:MAG: PH domain-containing protein [Proteobacteria bacterium]|nr:PH domain-containing protein [Pseudomonadota bacterium]
MGYIDENLISGEEVAYRARLHKVLFVGPAIFAMAFFALSYWLLTHVSIYTDYAPLSFVVGALIILSPMLTYISSEFAVTNKRVIAKVGYMRRQTVETFLQKIEAIEVQQSLFGRIFNWGTIVIIGTGGTNEYFQNIANPLAFRLAVEQQTDAKK